jgi:NAD(P)-dependent dehydrogenase (short-subunit alcohol dehydrogenase family)
LKEKSIQNQLKIDLKPNTRVIVSAGAAGIGQIIAEAFLLNGAKVFVCDISETAVENFNKKNPNGTALLADVSDHKQVSEFFRNAQEEMGGLDVLVNNAGVVGPTALVEDINPEDWDNTITVNLNSQFYFLKYAIPLLKQAGEGSIINIASSAAVFGYPRRAPYSASKWAMIGMTKTIAMETGPFNIRVNAICPGSVTGSRIEKVIQNDAIASGISKEEIKKLYLNQVSLHTFVDAQDIANTALFLASEYGKTISGQTFGVDGNTESLSRPIIIYKEKNN